MKKKELTDTQTKTIIGIIDIANKLSKISPEYKTKLYEIKHYLLNYIVEKKKHLIESIIPVKNDNHKLLEIKVQGGFIFHVPYHKKETYGFTWDENIKPEIYNKPKPEKPEFDPFKVFTDLFQIYVHLHGGICHVTSGNIRYWYTKYILRKLYNDETLELLREDDNPDVVKISPKTWLKFKIVKGEVIWETNYFGKFFDRAVKVYSNYFKASINNICKLYEQKL